MKNKKEIVWTCDFCEREFSSKEKVDSHEMRCYQNPKNQKFPFNNKVRRAWFWVWIITMVIFGITIFIFSNFFESGIVLFNKKSLSYFFVGNIILGIVAFLIWLLPLGKPKNNQISFFTKHVFILCLVYLFICPLIFASEGFKAQQDSDYKNKYFNSHVATTTPTTNQSVPTLTPTPTIKQQVKKTTSGTTTKSNLIDCVGPDGKHFQATEEKCKEFNNAWGNSSTSHDGSKTGKLITGYRSYCQGKNITVYENELIYYTRKDGSKIWSTKEDIACYERDYSQLENNNTKTTNTTSNVTQACLAGRKVLADVCTGMCEGTRSSSVDLCHAKSYSLTSEEYSSCLSDSTKAQQSCFDKCNSEYNAGIDSCLK